MTALVAHQRWFVPPGQEFPGDWGFATAPASLALMLAAVGVALAWRGLAHRRGAPELPVLAPLARLAPWVPRLLGIHLGVSLLALAVTNTYLAPHLSLDGVPAAGAVALAEGALGVWLVSGVALRPAALAVILLGPLGLGLAGPVAVLEAVDLLGVAVFLALLPPGADRWGARRVTAAQLRLPLLALRVCAGGALVVLAFSEKFTNPEMAVALIDRYPALNVFAAVGVQVDPVTFVRVAGAVELLFGLLIVSGAAPQAAVIVAGVPFNATLFFFGTMELVGHLPLYGVLLALLVYGSDRAVAPEVAWLPLPGPASQPGTAPASSGRA